MNDVQEFAYSAVPNFAYCVIFGSFTCETALPNQQISHLFQRASDNTLNLAHNNVDIIQF